MGLIAVDPGLDVINPDRGAHFNQHRISILRGAEQAIGEAGGSARFVSIDDWTHIGQDFPAAIESHLAAGASAIIVVDIHNHPGLADQVMHYVAKLNVPLIYVSSGETCNPPFHVYCDNKASGVIAGKHMLRQGYHDIIFVGPVNNIWVDERSEGVAKALESAGTAVRFCELPAKMVEFLIFQKSRNSMTPNTA